MSTHTSIEKNRKLPFVISLKSNHLYILNYNGCFKNKKNIVMVSKLLIHNVDNHISTHSGQKQAAFGNKL